MPEHILLPVTSLIGAVCLIYFFLSLLEFAVNGQESSALFGDHSDRPAVCRLRVVIRLPTVCGTHARTGTTSSLGLQLPGCSSVEPKRRTR